MLEFTGKSASGATVYFGCRAVLASDSMGSKTPGLTPVLDKCIVRGDGGVKINENATLLFGSSLIRYPGLQATVGQAYAGVQTYGVGAKVSLQGPLSRDVPGYVYGSRPRLGVKLDYQASPNLHFSADYSQELDSATPATPPVKSGNLSGEIMF